MVAAVVERGVEAPLSKAKLLGWGYWKLLRETENLRESVQFATRRPSFPRSALKGGSQGTTSDTARTELDWIAGIHMSGTCNVSRARSSVRQ